jgi:hypothetical protein
MTPRRRDDAPVRFAAAAAQFALHRSSSHRCTRVQHNDRKPNPGELARLHAELDRDSGVQEVRTRVIRGSTAAESAGGLQRTVDEEHADVVVVGSSRRGAISRVAPGTRPSG